MIRFQKVVLSHANLKRPVHIVAGTIAGYHSSEATASTHVYTTGGVFPVVETPEQIDLILDQLTAPMGHGAQKDVTDNTSAAVRQTGDVRKRQTRPPGQG